MSLSEWLQETEEGRYDQEVFSKLKASEAKVDKLCKDLETMDKEEVILQNSLAEKEKTIQDLKKQIKSREQGSKKEIATLNIC